MKIDGILFLIDYWEEIILSSGMLWLFFLWFDKNQSKKEQIDSGKVYMPSNLDLKSSRIGTIFFLLGLLLYIASKVINS